MSPTPRREHGQNRSREAAETSAWGYRRRALIHAVRATESGSGATHRTPNVRRMGGPETVRLVQAFLGLDSDRRDRRRPRKAPVSGRKISNLIMPRELVFRKELNLQQPMARQEKMGRSSGSPQIGEKMGDGGASPHFSRMNVRGLVRFRLTVFKFYLSVLGCLTLLWDPPHPQELKLRHVAHL